MTLDHVRSRNFIFLDGQRRAGALTLDQLNPSLDAGKS